MSGPTHIAHKATERLPVPAAESPFRRQTRTTRKIKGSRRVEKRKNIKNKTKTGGRRPLQHPHSPGYGFFYGSCAMGIGPGARSRRQTAWERMNNDAHLRKNISTMKSTMSTQPKKSWKSKLKKRQKILDRVKTIPNPVSRTMTAARELQLRMQELTAAHIRDGADDGGDRFTKSSTIEGGSAKELKSHHTASLTTYIEASVGTSLAMETAKKIRNAVRIVTERWQIPRANIPRLWLEVVLPESNVLLELGREPENGEHVELCDGPIISPPTRLCQFGGELRKCFRDPSTALGAQELFAAYLERRCVSTESLSEEQVAALWRLALKFGLEEDIVFGWHAGILGAVRILASVEMTEDKRALLRERLSSFIEWMNKVYEPDSSKGNSAKVLVPERGLKKLAVQPLGTAFKSTGRYTGGISSESVTKSINKRDPVPPVSGSMRVAGPRGRSIKAKIKAKNNAKEKISNGVAQGTVSEMQMVASGATDLENTPAETQEAAVVKKEPSQEKESATREGSAA